MKLTNAAVRLAMGGLAMGAGLVVARLLSRGRGDASHPAAEPPSPEQLIGAPQARLSAAEEARSFGGDPDRPH
ncbi:MAG: hypothetical protein ACM3Q1_04525 [Bacteroidales bacterium]